MAKEEGSQAMSEKLARLLAPEDDTISNIDSKSKIKTLCLGATICCSRCERELLYCYFCAFASVQYACETDIYDLHMFLDPSLAVSERS